MGLLTFSSIVFVFALWIVEFHDSTGTDITDRPISHYFNTGSKVVQDAAFLLLAIALWAHSFVLGLTWLSISLALVGVGLFGAMSSDTWAKMYYGYDRPVHYSSAALCFIAGLSMMLANGNYAYSLVYASVAGLLYAIDRQHTAVQEKVGVLILIIWCFAYSVGLK